MSPEAKASYHINAIDEFLVTNKIPTLYGTPKLFPEYEEGYYAVFFEDPDRIKLEVAYYS